MHCIVWHQRQTAGNDNRAAVFSLNLWCMMDKKASKSWGLWKRDWSLLLQCMCIKNVIKNLCNITKKNVFGFRNIAQWVGWKVWFFKIVQKSALTLYILIIFAEKIKNIGFRSCNGIKSIFVWWFCAQIYILGDVILILQLSAYIARKRKQGSCVPF